MTKTYKPNTPNLFIVSLLFSFAVYAVLLVIFFVLPNYFDTYRIYNNSEQIPYFFSLVTLLSAGIFILIFGLLYMLVSKLEASMENNELTFRLMPIIGSKKTFLIKLDYLLSISSRRVVLSFTEYGLIFTYLLKFIYKNNESQEVPTVGWDNTTLRSILTDINIRKPDVKIDTVFYKGGEFNAKR